MSHFTTIRIFILLLCFLLLSVSAGRAGNIWYVNDDAPYDPGPGDPTVSDPDEDGTEEHPFDAIQEGIEASSGGDVVQVADGIYTGGMLPDASRNRDMDFLGKAILVRSESGPDHCVIDCEGTLEQPHRAFSFINGEDGSSILQGFTIKNGYVFGPSFEERCGGAIYISGASPLITYNLIKKNKAFYAFELGAGGAIFCSGGAPAIINNSIRMNEAGWHGGGIACYNGASPVIMNNMISENKVFYRHGGGIFCYNQSSPRIENNTIELNEAAWDGGGIGCGEADHEMLIVNNTIRKNKAGRWGGGIHIANSTVAVINNLLYKNRGLDYGGAIYGAGSTIKIESTTFHQNEGGNGGHAICTEDSERVTLRNSILWDDTPEEIHGKSGDLPEIRYCDIRGGYPGEGNIDADPLFASIPSGGRHFLSQIAAGQSDDSPCVDAGDPESKAYRGTTRTDMAQDADDIDMGYHYPLPGVVLGPGPKDTNPAYVRIFPGQWSPSSGFDAYESGRYGVNVTCGDIDRDGFDEIITGMGHGPACIPRVRGFQVDSRPIPGLDFLAYGTQGFGVNVSSGDLAGSDSFHEVITGAGPGAVFSSHVRAFRYDPLETVEPLPGSSFRAYKPRSWGVNMASGDVDGDGFDEIITGAGPGPNFAPHIRGWNIDSGQVTLISALDFFAYSTRDRGVVVSCGDVDRDGFDEIVSAPGPSEDLGALVRVWDYDNRDNATQIFDLKAFNKQIRYGARIYVGTDFNQDGFHDLVVGAGPGESIPSFVKVYGYTRPYQGVSAWISFLAFPPTWTCGVNVAAGRF